MLWVSRWVWFGFVESRVGSELVAVVAGEVDRKLRDERVRSVVVVGAEIEVVDMECAPATAGL